MKICYSDHISWQLLDNVIYIIDEITRETYSLQEVAKDFWLQVKDNQSIEKIVEILAVKYNVSTDVITSDINEFKNSLLSKKLVKEVC